MAIMHDHVEVLDCTLRDGAHINHGLFGHECMRHIISALADCGIGVVELGFLQDCEPNSDSSIYSDISQAEDLLDGVENSDQQYCLMLRTDRCGLQRLRRSDRIGYVRIAMYAEHLRQVNVYAHRLKELGYKVGINPIAVSKYSMSELKELLEGVLELQPDAVALVDTFGALRPQAFAERLCLFDELLPPSVTLGIHLHENLSLALSLALQATAMLQHRRLLIDSSVSGMGRVPGNLPTELLLGALDRLPALQAERLAEAAQICERFRCISPWGYSPLYALSALLNIDRTYPEFFASRELSPAANIRAQHWISSRGYGHKFNDGHARQAISMLAGQGTTGMNEDA